MRAVTPSAGSAEGGSTAAVGPGATHPLAVPLMLPGAAGGLAVAAAALLVDARQPYFSTRQLPDLAAGAALHGVLSPPVPPHARGLSFVPSTPAAAVARGARIHQEQVRSSCSLVSPADLF
jgi:hypothetical protein